MLKKRIITVAGSLGSGKSSTANRVAEILEYQRSSTGDFMRAIANQRGISLEELSKQAESDPSIDKTLDDYNHDIAEKDKIVLDSRLGFYFVPKSFKVFLELDPNIAAERILKDSKTNSNRVKETKLNFDNIKNIVKSISDRLSSERKRYFDLYGIIDHTDKSNFDLIINTANLSMEEVAQKIVEEYKKYINEITE